MDVNSLAVRMGVANDGMPVLVDIMRTAAHWAVQGQTRSGKSQAEYNVLGRLAGEPTVRVIGCDPSSLLLAPFAARGEPLVSLGTDDPSCAIEVLRWAREESDRRIADLLSQRKDRLDSFSDGRPLIVVVLEEYAALLELAEDDDAACGRKPGDRLEPQIRRLVRQLVAQSAKAGVRVLLSTQRAEAATVGGASRSNFGIRLTLRVDNADSVRMLHPSADNALCESVMSFMPGVGVLDVPGRSRVLLRGPVTEYGDYFEQVVSRTGGAHG